jgi:hypothetical protein
MHEEIKFLSCLHNIQKRKLHLNQQISFTSAKENESPDSKESGPPPSLVQEFLPKPTHAEKIQMNIDVPTILGKMNMLVLVVKKCKIPSVIREVMKALKVPNEEEYPPMMLNTMYHGQQRDTNPPFYISLGVNGLRLKNCMLDFEASTNMMSLKVMKQLGLKTTCIYGNVCGIDSKKVKVYGLIEDVEFNLEYFPHMALS